jgi:YesN/AraC family two-component response regulator
MPRILLIDDERLPLKTREMILQMRGYDVVATASGKEAIAIFANEDFDLVITDFLMPVMTGLDLAAEMKKQSADTPIVLLAGYGKFFNAEQVKKKGIDYLLGKPCTSEQLLSLVDKIFAAMDGSYDCQLPQAA